MNIPASNSARTALKPTSWWIFRRAFVLTALALASLALSSPVRVVLPPADAGYAGVSTAEGSSYPLHSFAIPIAFFFWKEVKTTETNK